jgi:mannan endo-1,4-beta-mannosidase
MKRVLTGLLASSFVAAIAAPRPYVLPNCPAGPQGYYVSGSQLFKPDGSPYRIRGLNDVHWDQRASVTGIQLTGANSVRIVIDFAQTVATNQSIVDPFVAAGLLPIPGNWTGTCKADAATLGAIVDTWVAQKALWATHYANTALINIANEWGPGSTTSTPVPYKANAITPNYAWRDGYVAAIKRMRDAGYTQTLVVDAGSCGQDAQTVIRDGAAVLASDPQRNVLFDVHVYGGFYRPATAAWQQDYDTAMAALKATGLPIMIGEFGPGQNVGPSPTPITPQTIVATAEANGWGWMPWAYNDNNLGGCKTSDTGWFGMTSYCSNYTGKDAELTAFGRLMVPILKSYVGKP